MPGISTSHLDRAAAAYWSAWPEGRVLLLGNGASEADAAALEVEALFGSTRQICAHSEAQALCELPPQDLTRIPPVALRFEMLDDVAVPCQATLFVVGEPPRPTRDFREDPQLWQHLQEICDHINERTAHPLDLNQAGDRAVLRKFTRAYWRSRKRTVARQRQLPPALAQQTFIEARRLCIALADGATLRHWTASAGGLSHVLPRDGFAVSFALAAGTTSDRLDRYMRSTGIAATIGFQVLVGLARERGSATLRLDDFIRLAGLPQKTERQRDLSRERAKMWIEIFDALRITGRRPGKYRDERLEVAYKLDIDEPLLRVTLAPDAHSISVELNPWMKRLRTDRRILANFGDVRELTTIPAGKVSGAWARSIGLSLQQLWRERAREVSIHYIGEMKRPTVRWNKPFTRALLLDLFRAEPLVEDLLYERNPARAQQYWDAAVRLLRSRRIIGYYAELEPLDGSRRGWQSTWLAQPLDIRPGREYVEALLAISQKARRKARGQRVAGGTQSEEMDRESVGISA